MKKTGIQLVVIMNALMIASQTFSMGVQSQVATEQKVKAEQQNNPAFDKAASEKRNRRMLNRDRQWVAHQLQQRAQQAPQALGDDQELCSGSCGCLGTEKRRDCLAAGFPIPLISYILSFFSRMG